MQSTPTNRLNFLSGGGEMGERIRQFDWNSGPLGDPRGWPSELRTLVQVMLTSQQPMFIAWGPERVMLYNDGYAPMCANRHPWALGRPFEEVWADIIKDVGPIMDAAYAGVPTYMDDIEFLMTRHGKPVETHFSFGYTPVHDASDGIVGMFCTALEITADVMQSKAEVDRLRELFSQAPSFMAVLSGPDHVFEITNQAYLQLIGHRDVLGKRARDALPEVAGQGFYELLDTVYSTGEPFVGHGLQIYLQREPGAAREERFLDFIYQPIRSAAGVITGVFAQGHDITDQKRAEMASVKSEAKFTQLAQSLPNHVWTAKPSGELDWFNDQVYAYSGAGRGELDGTGWTLLVHPEDVPSAAAAWQAATENASHYKTEFRLRRFDDAYRWHLARATPIADETGQLVYWVGTNTDIEEQKAAELALRESELQVKLALSAARMGVWECDVVEGVFVNLRGDDQAITLLGGVPGEQSSFETFTSRISPEDRDGLRPAAERALAPDGDGVLDIEYRILPRAGEKERWVHARAQALVSAAGTRLVGTVRDISHRKEAEARQQVLASELQHRIKNTLAMVSAIATQTLRGEDISDRRSSFNARLEALARAHDLLTAATWESASVHAVLASALAAHDSGDDRIVIEGVDLQLGPKQALSLALTVHELATNAAKYGALSTDNGKVHITWTNSGFDELGNRQFKFVWREVDGPPVQVPRHSGFGTRLISRVLAADFSGSVSIDYAPEGVVSTLTAPVESLGSGPHVPAVTERAL
ncbi:MAG TPA: PAS domain-containing protein [Devosia sp.]